MAALAPPFPFVVGCGRSGTTLLRAMLDSHPDMVVPPESRFIPRLARREESYRRGDRLDPDLLMDDLGTDRHFQHWGLHPGDVRLRLHEREPSTLADAVRVLFEMQAAAAGKRRYGDKSPPYVMQLPVIAELLPEARFVHLVRDGRDVALAYLDASFGPRSVAEAGLHWRLRVERGRRAGTQLGPARYREVRYESLVEDPEATLREICEFVELPFDRAMLRHTERLPELMAHDRAPGEHRSLSRPPTAGLRDWRVEMPPADVAAFELVAGETLKRFGYSPSAVMPDVRDRAAVALARLRWLGRRLRAKVRL